MDKNLEPTKETEEEMEVEVLDTPENNFESMYNEAQDRCQRTLAEFDNFRKRTAKEMAARYEDGLRATCEKFLPIIDNFDRALETGEGQEDDKFYQGVALIARQFDNVLAELGVQPIKLEIGDAFDPNLHNAVAHVEDESMGQNVIADVLQKGYIHKDKVLRHSMVKVAN